MVVTIGFIGFVISTSGAIIGLTKNNSNLFGKSLLIVVFSIGWMLGAYFQGI